MSQWLNTTSTKKKKEVVRKIIFHDMGPLDTDLFIDNKSNKKFLIPSARVNKEKLQN